MSYTEREHVESLLEQARQMARAANDKAWALESAVSLWRKSQKDYRASALLGDAPWDEDQYAYRIAEAVHNLDTHLTEDGYRAILKAHGASEPYRVPKSFHSINNPDLAFLEGSV